MTYSNLLSTIGHNVAVLHPSLTSLSYQDLTPKYVRPPFGDTARNYKGAAWAENFDTNGWSLTTGKSTINDVLNIFNGWTQPLLSGGATGTDATGNAQAADTGSSQSNGVALAVHAANNSVIIGSLLNFI
ncbi:3144_t:CDS:2 [Paraglomus brasilianum]|uniref:3144_t:CDS:1 n=1 Tax=Paraglomus brasilianum TaxID=144538 RepID=A0A9N9E4G1_9GLOM|nr:3144_t:CDS:2 [Paraglomus brasilianum]